MSNGKTFVPRFFFKRVLSHNCLYDKRVFVIRRNGRIEKFGGGGDVNAFRSCLNRFSPRIRLGE